MERYVLRRSSAVIVICPDLLQQVREAGWGDKAVLLEKDDFGGATTWNSLKILHGGLRYLQTMDFTRFFESVGERRWFLKRFPGTVGSGTIFVCRSDGPPSGLLTSSVKLVAQ